MVEKRLDLGEFTSLSKSNVRNLINILLKNDFFSKPEEGYEEVYTLLRIAPNEDDPLNGRNYIRHDYFKGERVEKARIYDFDGDVISSCS